MRPVLFTLLLLSVAAVMPTLVAQPAATPLRLIVEAEDFKPVSGDWKPQDFGTNYFANTFAICFLSRGRYLGAPDQGEASVAEREIDIPRDGVFEAWVRYEQPYNYAVEFDLEIQQEGKTVFKHGYGRIDSPKLWPFKEGMKPQVLWQWGPTDNIVWEGKDTKAGLKAGKAKLLLKKGPQKAAEAARRNVDVIVLTDDKAGVEKQIKEARYLPLDGWLTQDGDLLFQVSNPADAPTPVAVHFGPCTEHSPYWVHVRDWEKQQTWLGKDLGVATPKPEGYLKPGDKSPLTPVGQLFDTLNQFQWKVHVVGPDGKPAANRKVGITFLPPQRGEKPYRDAVLTTGPDGTVTFFLDGDIRRTKRIRTVEEDLEGLLAYVKTLPKIGKRPEKLPIFGIMGFSGVLQEKGRAAELAREIGELLGSNTMPESKLPVQNAMIDVRDVPDKDLAAHCQKLKADGKWDRIKVVSLGDEIHIGGAAKSPQDDPAFREFLKKRKLPPAELDLKSLDDARLEMQNKASKLYYWSQMFAFEQSLDHYKKRTDILEANLPKGVGIGANYSPHPYYWPKEGQWIRAFKRKAMTLPWGEDYTWQIPEASQQINGYLLTAFRAGARHHDFPIHWYAMPHAPGNTADNFRRSYWTAIGHGAKQINFFCATPLSVGYTENYIVSEAKDTWKAIHEVVHQTGAIEEAILTSRTRVGEVGVLCSFAQDLWETDPVVNHERKSLYLALRHGGYSPEFITEEDVQEDQIQHLKVIYVVGNHMEAATAKKLKHWVNSNGGVLAGLAGGGFLDEHNRPMSILNEVYGVKEQSLEIRDKVVMSKQELPRLKPLDVIMWTEQDVKRTKFPALAMKQTFKPAEKTVIRGKYADGSPAVLLNSHGQGFSYLYGGLIASAYIRSGMPIRPNDRSPAPDGFSQFLPTDFDGELGDLVTAPCSQGEVRYEYITNEPLVETTILEGPNHVVVVLVNWTPQPKKVKLTVQYLRKEFTKATSLKSGPLGILRIQKTGSFDVNVDVADVVVLEK
jgi:hypothetical protein